MGTEKLSVVPQVFYDLISRVPAGMVILLTGGILLSGCHVPWIVTGIGSSTLAAVVVPVVGFVVSYVIGLALSAISGFSLFRIFDWCLQAMITKGFESLSKLTDESSFRKAAKSGFGNRRKFGKRLARRMKLGTWRTWSLGLRLGLSRGLWLGFRIRRKAQMRANILVKWKSAEDGLEISKHQAETSLFANLTIGFALLCVVFLCSDSISCLTATLAPSACRTVAILVVVSAFVAYLRYRSGWSHLFAFAESILKSSGGSRLRIRKSTR